MVFSQSFPKNWYSGVWYRGGGDGRVTVALHSEKISPLKLEQYLTENVEPALAKIRGTERAWVWTLEEEVLAVEFVSEKLLRANVSAEEASNLLQK